MSFEIIRPDAAQPELPLIIHVPHSSTHIPEDIRPSLLPVDARLAEIIHAMTDHYTDQLFESASGVGATMLINQTSRLVLDPERFPEDKNELAVKYGMGAVYMKDHEGKNLRAPSFGQHKRTGLMMRLYDPFHTAMNELTEEFLTRFGSCFIIDAHSFPNDPLPFEDPSLQRPDVCIGYNDFHKPKEWVDWFKSRQTAPQQLALNQPFSGSFVPAPHYGKNKRVKSMMIELNRSGYMDEVSGKKNRGWDSCIALIDDFLRFVAGNLKKYNHKNQDLKFGRGVSI